MHTRTDDHIGDNSIAIKTILIAIDGSAHARKAAFIGAAIAAKFDARVVLLHVLLRNIPYAAIYRLLEQQKISAEEFERLKLTDPISYGEGASFSAGVVNPLVATELLIELGRHILENQKEEFKARGVSDVTVRMEDGDPADRIIEAVEKEKAEIVIVGHRGLGALQALVTGSVSTKVNHLASVTVVSVK